MRKSKFSIIELMTVILIIFVLISLLTPVFKDINTKARTTICLGQLRQIGGYINIYAADNSGYLPNDAGGGADGGGTPYACDIGNYVNTSLYRYWDGHLLPYTDVNFKTKFARNAYVDLTGGIVSMKPATPVGGDVTADGWVIIKDALEKGGYDELKVFICPEIARTVDLNAMINYNGARIPRISRIAKTGYQVENGTPTTYLANQLYFGFGVSKPFKLDTINSMRLDSIDNVANKLFLMEGGTTGTDWANSREYYFYLYSGDKALHGYDLGRGHPGDCDTRFTKSQVQYQKPSYVHDTVEEFWISNNSQIPPKNWGPEDRWTLGFKFNEHFRGKAYMIPCTLDSSSNDPSYVIVSYTETLDGKIFDNFLKVNYPSLIGTSWGSFEQFVDFPNEWNYLVGNMNVLFGDGSAQTKDLGWLSLNRQKIGF